jgi:hypothetical protein
LLSSCDNKAAPELSPKPSIVDEVFFFVIPINGFMGLFDIYKEFSIFAPVTFL